MSSTVYLESFSQQQKIIKAIIIPSIIMGFFSFSFVNINEDLCFLIMGNVTGSGRGGGEGER